MSRSSAYVIRLALVCLALAPAGAVARSDGAEVDEALLARLGDDFRAFKTNYFNVYYNTSRSFARKRALLLGRLYRAYRSTFKKINVPLHHPDAKLTVVLFDDHADFGRYTGLDASAQLAGLYMTDRNQAVFFDTNTDPQYLATKRQMTQAARDLAQFRQEVQALESETQRRRYMEMIAQKEQELATYGRKLENTLDTENVSTVIHEAAHALSFNLGPFSLEANNIPPRWLAEGVAMLFETPREGRWKGAARFNPRRYVAYARALENGTLPPLRRLLTQDDGFFSPNAETTYGVTWALTFFLYHVREPQFKALVENVAKTCTLPPDQVSKARLIRDFENAMGKPVAEVEEEWHRYMTKAGKRHQRETREWLRSLPQ